MTESLIWINAALDSRSGELDSPRLFINRNSWLGSYDSFSEASHQPSSHVFYQPQYDAEGNFSLEARSFALTYQKSLHRLKGRHAGRRGLNHTGVESGDFWEHQSRNLQPSKTFIINKLCSKCVPGRVCPFIYTHMQRCWSWRLQHKETESCLLYLLPAAELCTASALLSCLVSRQYFADFDLVTPEGFGCHRSGYHGYEYNPGKIW